MKLHIKIQLLKFCSMVLNFIFLVLGVSVAGCGLWILFDTSFISAVSSDSLRVVALALLAVGGLVLGVSVLGLLGAQRESRLLLLPVAVLLVLLVLAQIFVTVLLVFNRDKISDTVTEAVDKLIEQYPNTSHPHLLDTIQRDAECCGRTGPSDWLNNSFVQSLNQSDAEVLPCSCFSSNRHEPGTFCFRNLTLSSIDLYPAHNSSYDTGCQEALRVWLWENVLTILAMDVGLILIQILQLAVVASLYRSFGAKSSKVKSSEPEPDQDQDQDQDQVYSDRDLLHQDRDRGLYHGEPYDDPNPDYSRRRK